MSESNQPQNAPYVMEMEPGKSAWCSCAQSSNQPFCDGSHRGTDKSPVVVEVTEKKFVAWCGCKQTKNPPYCDGTHSNLV